MLPFVRCKCPRLRTFTACRDIENCYFYVPAGSARHSLMSRTTSHEPRALEVLLRLGPKTFSGIRRLSLFGMLLLPMLIRGLQPASDHGLVWTHKFFFSCLRIPNFILFLWPLIFRCPWSLILSRGAPNPSWTPLDHICHLAKLRHYLGGFHPEKLLATGRCRSETGSTGTIPFLLWTSIFIYIQIQITVSWCT